MKSPICVVTSSLCSLLLLQRNEALGAAFQVFIDRPEVSSQHLVTDTHHSWAPDGFPSSDLIMGGNRKEITR